MEEVYLEEQGLQEVVEEEGFSAEHRRLVEDCLDQQPLPRVRQLDRVCSEVVAVLAQLLRAELPVHYSAPHRPQQGSANHSSNKRLHCSEQVQVQLPSLGLNPTRADLFSAEVSKLQVLSSEETRAVPSSEEIQEALARQRQPPLEAPFSGGRVLWAHLPLVRELVGDFSGLNPGLQP